MRTPLRLMVHALLVLLCLTGCAQKITSLPKAPAITEELKQQLWPKQGAEIDYIVQGTLHLQDIDIPLQGRLYRSSDNQLIIALLTSFGSSLLEARISENENQIISQSPILTKHGIVKTFILQSIRQAYMSPTQCFAEMDPENIMQAQLRCKNNKGNENNRRTEENNDVYIFSKELNGTYTLQRQFPESAITIEYTNLNTSPSFVAQQSRYGFILNLKHSL